MNNLRDLYERLLEIPEHERERWLAAHCDDAAMRAKLWALLEAGDTESADPLARPAAARLAIFDAQAAAGGPHWIGQRVGAFRLRKLIGQGGMAAVFLATREDADFEQQVAVKLLQRGLFSEIEQQLFRRERQALASLSHPNIARLIDGGIAERGIPYLAMEYVDGVPITRYCAERHATLRERLALFLMVCHAVDAAHRALIVHRDIKPSNILVTADGAIKLLDFGIAKLLEDKEQPATRTGLAAMTPEYAAPEQFEGGTITTATDVYALGVLLHELLVGERPRRDDTGRASLRAVGVPGAGDDTAPQSLRRLLRGDVGNIVLKALEPEPERRYASAGSMAEDIDRYLNGQPVAAHPPSRWYRTRKFIRRHRGGVAATLLLALGILASLAVALWQARIARIEAARANEVTGFMMALFENTIPARPAERMPTTAELLEQGIAEIESRRDLDPGTRLRLMSMLAAVTSQVGLQEDADRLARAILEDTSAQEPDPDGDRATALLVQSQRASSDGDLARALELADQAIAAAVHAPALEIEARYHQATLLFNSGKTSDGIAGMRAAVALSEKTLGAGHQQSMEARKKLAMAIEAAGDPGEAAALLQASLAESERRFGPDHSKVGEILTRLAILEAKRERFDVAEPLARRAVAIMRKVYPRPHRKLLESIGWLSDVLRRADRSEEYLVATAEAEAIARALIGETHRDYASYINNLGVAELEAERPGRGEAALRSALALLERHFGTDDPRTLATLHSIARASIQLGRAADAMPILDDVLARKRRVLGDGHVSVLRSEIVRAEGLIALKRYDEAAALLDAGREAVKKMVPPPLRESARLQVLRIEALSLAGRAAAARKALADLGKAKGAAREDRCRALLWRAEFARADAAGDAAASALAEAGPICQLPSTRARLAAFRP